MAFAAPLAQILAFPIQALVGGISYLLNDEFTTDRAAGAVNGTQAEPTGGTRTVVDTGNYLSITGGQLSSTGGVSALGNPGIWYPSTARVAGKTLVMNYTPTTGAGKEATPGWSGVTSGWPSQHSIDFQGYGTLVGYDNYTIINGLAPVNTIVTGTTYNIAFVLRTSGAYYYIKGGVYTNWTLLWISANGTTTPLYPTIGGYNEVFAADNVRIPTATWLPTPLAYDTFTRADGAIGSSETIGPDSQTTPSLAWTNQVGISQVSGNKIITTALTGGIAIATVPAGADVLASIALVRGTGSPGVVFRYLNSLNYGYAIHNGTNAQMHKVVNGVDTTLVNVARTYVASAAILVILYGTKWRLFYKNAFIGAVQTVSDADLLSGTGVGWYSTDIDSTGDLFTVFARGTAGEYDAGLDPYYIA